MILLLGPMNDPVLANVASRIAARCGEMMILHPEYGADLSWSTLDGRASGQMLLGGRFIDASEVEAVYIRSFGYGSFQDAERRLLVSTLWEWTDGLSALVVNRRRAVHTNVSKPYQQRLIARQGFSVPKTLITMMPERALEFYEACQERVIYKSVSAERSIVKRLTPDDLPKLAQVRYCPVQLQELIPGIDVRVHTIGERVFASEIVSDGLDYRYISREEGRRTIRAVELPTDVQSRCLRLAASLDLSLSGIDLRRTPDGEYYCFEVNTSPAFVFYENHTGQRIGDALADLLCSGQAYSTTVSFH